MRVEQYNVFILIQSIPINMKEERNLENTRKSDHILKRPEILVFCDN